MTTLAIAATLMTLTQFADVLPEERPRVFVLEDGTKIVGFVEDEDWREEPMVIIRPDEPWNPGQSPRHVRVQEIGDHYRESRFGWRERHQRAWRERGYVNLDEDRDEYYWVPKQQVELAERAREMAVSASTTVEAEPVTGPAPEPTSAIRPEAQQHSILQLWGPHAAIVGLAIVLAGLVVRFVLLG